MKEDCKMREISERLFDVLDNFSKWRINLKIWPYLYSYQFLISFAILLTLVFLFHRKLEKVYKEKTGRRKILLRTLKIFLIFFIFILCLIFFIFFLIPYGMRPTLITN